MTRMLRHYSLAYIIAALGAAATLVAWYLTGEVVERQIHADMETRAQETISVIERRAQRYVDLLHGLEGLFGHDLSVSRAEFNRYIASLNLPKRFPGVRAMEYLRRVKDSERAVYENTVRTDRSIAPGGYPEFSVKPQDRQDEYYVIHYVEPMPGNEAAFGLDIRSREGSRLASERARDTGEPMATGRYHLVQDTTDQLGMVVYLPVYETYRARRTLAERNAELAGFVNIVFRAKDLFVDTGIAAHRYIPFRVHDIGATGGDANAPTDGNLMYASPSLPNPQSPVIAALTGDVLEKQMVIAGRQWVVRFGTPGSHGSPLLQPLSLLVLITGTVITALLFIVLRMQSRSRRAAEQMAESATRELREQLGFSRQLLEAIPNPVFFKDAEGRYIGCNRAFEEFTNRPRSEYLGKKVLDVTTSEAARRHNEIEGELLQHGGARVYEMSLVRSTDGKPLDAIYNKATFVDTDGKVAGLVGVIIDISERKSLERTLSESNQKLRSIIEGSPLAIIARDLHGVISLWNPAAEKMFGWKAEEMLGTNNSIVPEDIRPEVLALRRQVEQGMMLSLEDTRRVRKDGVVMDVSLSVAPIHDASQTIVGTMVLLADISRRKQAEDALRESEAQLRLAMEAADMGSWYWNLETGEITFSEGFGPLFGLSRGTFFREYSQFLGAMHPDDRSATDAAVRRALKLDTGFDMECRIIWPDGSIHWMAVKGQVSRTQSGRAQRIVGVTTDITSRRNAEQRIAYLAHHDALTGLPNRVLLQDRIGQAIAHSHRNGTQVAVLFIDLDHFKTINDSMGHHQGDVLLQLVAARIQSCLREIDTVSRLGGDEFVIVIPALSISPGGDGGDATAVAMKILDALSTHFQVQANDLHIGASVGISIYPTDGETAELLMRNADTAMYHAKERGRNQYQFFTQEMNTAAQQRLTMQLQLRRSLQSNDFCLVYQPVFSTASEELIGFEALLRWKNAAGELVRPGNFISVAEDSGLIIPIGEWVIRDAARTAAVWQKKGKALRIAINVSAIQLRRKSFAGMVADILAETGADPQQLEMEITESVIVGGHDEAIATLRKVDAMGIRIAIDDFGTGYSGLSYLKQFPIDTVKIDQSFIRDLTIDAEDEAIVRAIIAMSQSLGLSVVAEGVETAEQLAILRGLDCDMVQGYHFSHPLSVEAAGDFIDAHKTTAAPEPRNC
ncbi:MAG: EAL domain-containing protein [Betaproteobacteria bacterium]